VQNRVLGPEHPETLNTIANLTSLAAEMGNAIGAQELYASVLAIRARTLGHEHPDTFQIRAALAIAIGHGGDPASARDRLRALLLTFERVLGSEHPRTLQHRSHPAPSPPSPSTPPSPAHPKDLQALPSSTTTSPARGSQHQDPGLRPAAPYRSEPSRRTADRPGRLLRCRDNLKDSSIYLSNHRRSTRSATVSQPNPINRHINATEAVRDATSKDRTSQALLPATARKSAETRSTTMIAAFILSPGAFSHLTVPLTRQIRDRRSRSARSCIAHAPAGHGERTRKEERQA
jgi:hypothetical protein